MHKSGDELIWTWAELPSGLSLRVEDSRGPQDSVLSEHIFLLGVAETH